MRVLDLFSGIGGFSLGLERTGGFETVAFCEIEDYPRKVLAKHWPGVPIYDDVRTLTADRLASDGITGIDVITGGFPCQDLSVAGKQAGMGEGTRSGLWSEIARLIGELRPRYAIVENVTALLSGDRGRWFGRVLGDLASLGYDAEWHCIPASELGAHHHRDRVWIIAYTGLPEPSGRIQASQGQQSGQRREAWGEPASLCGNVENANGPRLEEHRVQFAGIFERPSSTDPSPKSQKSDMADTDSAQRQRDECPIGILAEYADFGRSSWWSAEPDVGRTFDGFPYWMDRHCGKGMNYEESQRSVETLRSLWSADVAEALWQNIGGLGRIQQAEALFDFVRKFQTIREKRDAALEVEKACKEIVRSVWGAKELACTSLRSESSEQRFDESANPMQVVPQFPPCDSKTAWQIDSWEDGVPRVANGIPHRAHRLKGLGNAVVPQIPELIGRAIMDYEANYRQPSTGAKG